MTTPVNHPGRGLPTLPEFSGPNRPVLSEDCPEGSLKGLLPLFRARPTQAQTDSSQTDSRHHGLHGGLDQDGLEAGNANGGIRIFEAMAGHGGRHQ